jgi:hypothetical protein
VRWRSSSQAVRPSRTRRTRVAAGVRWTDEQNIQATHCDEQPCSTPGVSTKLILFALTSMFLVPQCSLLAALALLRRKRPLHTQYRSRSYRHHDKRNRGRLCRAAHWHWHQRTTEQQHKVKDKRQGLSKRFRDQRQKRLAKYVLLTYPMSQGWPAPMLEPAGQKLPGCARQACGLALPPVQYFVTGQGTPFRSSVLYGQ